MEVVHQNEFHESGNGYNMAKKRSSMWEGRVSHVGLVRTEFTAEQLSLWTLWADSVCSECAGGVLACLHCLLSIKLCVCVCQVERVQVSSGKWLRHLCRQVAHSHYCLHAIWRSLPVCLLNYTVEESRGKRGNNCRFYFRPRIVCWQVDHVYKLIIDKRYVPSHIRHFCLLHLGKNKAVPWKQIGENILIFFLSVRPMVNYWWRRWQDKPFHGVKYDDSDVLYTYIKILHLNLRHININKYLLNNYFSFYPWQIVTLHKKHW